MVVCSEARCGRLSQTTLSITTSIWENYGSRELRISTCGSVLTQPHEGNGKFSKEGWGHVLVSMMRRRERLRPVLGINARPTSPVWPRYRVYGVCRVGRALTAYCSANVTSFCNPYTPLRHSLSPNKRHLDWGIVTRD